MSPEVGILDDGDMETTSTLLAPLPLHPQEPAPPALVQARDLTRVWGKGHAAQIGVDEVDLDVGRGELMAIIGPSGSGKSTLGSLLAGIDNPTSGSLVIDGERIDQMKSDKLATWRGANVGIVFQDFHLLPTLTAAENVELAVELAPWRTSRRARKRAARDALDQVGLGGHERKLPAQMSGGEQQRVGIARAIVKHPKMIVADEPTGSLDQANGHVVFEMLTGLSNEGTTVVFITHDLAFADAADRVVSMIDGRVDSITEKGTGR